MRIPILRWANHLVVWCLDFDPNQQTKIFWRKSNVETHIPIWRIFWNILKNMQFGGLQSHGIGNQWCRLHQTTWVIEREKHPSQTIPEYQYQLHRRGEVGNDSLKSSVCTSKKIYVWTIMRQTLPNIHGHKCCKTTSQSASKLRGAVSLLGVNLKMPGDATVCKPEWLNIRTCEVKPSKTC